MATSIACINEGCEFPRLRANSLLICDDGLWSVVDCGGRHDRTSILGGLTSRGIDPSRIEVLFLTHLHFDHCENSDLFDRAEIVVHREEYEFMDRLLSEPSVDGLRALLSTAYDCMPPFYLRTILRRLADCRPDYARLIADRGRLRLIEGDHSKIGGFEIIKTSGHSVGHVSIGLRLPEPVWIAGDAVVSLRAWQEPGQTSQHLCWRLQDERSSRAVLGGLDGVLVPGHGSPFIIRTGKPMSFRELE